MMKHRFLKMLSAVTAALMLAQSASAVSAGDINGDGMLTVADAVLLMRYVAEDDALADTVLNAKNADVDQDGLLTVMDVQSLLRVICTQPVSTEPAVPQQTETTETTAVTQADYLAALQTLPPFSDSPYVTVNSNAPFFRTETYGTAAFESYAPLDDLGRCGACISLIGQELMPTEKRGSIGMIKPSGWQLVRYDGIVEGNYLFNRCHLIGYQLTGENANVCNLITGTRYLNVTGMLPFENQTADYIKSTGNHVLYRVTPYFEGTNLLAAGVLMEAQSLEDAGAGLCFNVFCYNVQPQIHIDYATGESYLLPTQSETPEHSVPVTEADYIVNLNTGKFHLPSCASVADIKEGNKLEFSGEREDLIAQGYTPCKRCNP